MKTLVMIFAFSACTFGSSPPKPDCPKPQCPADCGIETGDNGCPECACLKNVTIIDVKPKCSPPKCSGGCTLENVPGKCPRCSCPNVSGGKNSTCPQVKCPGECAIGLGANGCELCNCPQKTKSGKNSTCPQDRCPGECAIGHDANGCMLCSCSQDTKHVKNSTCPQVKCPGQCALSLDANGCQLCECGQGTKSGNGLDKQLGEACLSTTDCKAAYSTCQNNVCKCIDGFKVADGEICKPPALQCPTWKGQTKPVVGKACEHKFMSDEHTCDKDKEFCFIHPKEKTETGSFVGHCCPKPPQDTSVTLVCPYAASNNGTCPDLSNFPADAPIPEGKQRTCSYVTSDCIHQFQQAVCCPIPCTGASSHFSVNGKCYDYVQIGEVCDNDAVCIGGSHCSHQGSGKPLCRCAKKTCYEPSQHCCE